MIKKHIYIFFFLYQAISSTGMELFGEVTVPARPVLLAVNVDTATRNTILHWKHNTEDDIIYHIFKYDEFGDPLLYDSVYQLPLNNYYMDKNAGASGKSEGYLLHVIQYPDSSRISANQYSIPLSSLFTTVRFDSCLARNTVEWTTKFSLWDGVTKNFTIFRKKNNGSPRAVATVEGTRNSYIDENIEPHQQYTYFVKASKQDDTLSVFSNKTSISTPMSRKPDYIISSSTLVNDENTLKVTFMIDPAGETNQYILTRAKELTGKYDTIHEFITRENTLTFTDTDVLTSREKYYYKLQAINNCGRVIYESAPVNSLLLSGLEEEKKMVLNWNSFIPLATTRGHYSLHRIEPETSFLINPGVNQYTDKLDELQWKNHEGLFCYYLESEYIDTFENKKHISRSNTSCIPVQTEIMQMPTAVNPLSKVGEINRAFKPFLTFSPKSYYFVIYDRWGRKMFETSDPLVGWDGSILSGKKAPEGVYIYKIKLISHDGHTREKPGTVTLVYR